MNKLTMVLLQIVVVLVLMSGAFYKGFTLGKQLTEANQTTATLQEVDKNESTERKIMGLDQPSLSRGLSFWLRD